MPAVDVAKLRVDDIKREAQGLPTRYAQSLKVDMTPLNSGAWEDLDANNLVWRLRVQSRGALSLNFGFTQYRMPAGGRLLVYPAGLTRASIDRTRCPCSPPPTTKATASCGRRWCPATRPSSKSSCRGRRRASSSCACPGSATTTSASIAWCGVCRWLRPTRAPRAVAMSTWPARKAMPGVRRSAPRPRSRPAAACSAAAACSTTPPTIARCISSPPTTAASTAATPHRW